MTKTLTKVSFQCLVVDPSFGGQTLHGVHDCFQGHDSLSYPQNARDESAGHLYGHRLVIYGKPPSRDFS